MKWQKAKIVSETFRGRVVWVTRTEVRTCCGRSAISGDFKTIEDGLHMNVRHPSGSRMMCSRASVELLPEFDEWAPVVSWEEFVEGKGE
jgi:hypothetical protein